MIDNGPKMVKRRISFASFTRYPNKIIVRIGRLLIEAGWYRGEAPVLVTVKAFEWFAHGSEIVILYAQVAKAVLCVSWVGR